MKVRSYKELELWRLSMDMVDIVYDVTSRFRVIERYGLARQMRRSAVSVPSDIAEGSARSGTKELIQFIYIARGSLSELETQLAIADRKHCILDVPSLKHAQELIITVSKMLTRLAQALKPKHPESSPSTIHHSPFTIAEEVP